MDAHFKDSFANRLAVTEIAVFGRADAKDDAGTPHFVFPVGKPIVEFLGAFKGAHAMQCTGTQSLLQLWGKSNLVTMPNPAFERDAAKARRPSTLRYASPKNRRS